MLPLLIYFVNGSILVVLLLQMGSAVLLGLYTVIKYFGKEWINWFLGYFFAINGVVSVWKVSRFALVT